MLEQMFDEIDEDDMIDEFDELEEFGDVRRVKEEAEEEEEVTERRRPFMTYSDYDNELDNDEKRRLMEIGITDN